MTRTYGWGAIVILAALMLWLVPAIGFVLFIVVAIAVPPWGRTLIERGVISAIVIMGFVALGFPRAGATPIDATSVRVFLVTIMVAMLALNLVPRLRDIPLPRPRLIDGLIIGVGVLLWFILVLPLQGGSASEVISGLYFAGWDNHAHYTTFANTYISQSTTWPTVDGSIAWNQWYPTLHTTLWALGTYFVNGAGLDRIDLLVPYVQWSALSFALAMVALAWMASDLAFRWGVRTSRRTASTAAFVSIGIISMWVFLGSPQFLFNAGFTNFTMGVSLVAVSSYLAIRSTRSAQTLGWFIVPLAALAVIGLWTPLLVGLAPAGVIIAITLIRSRPIGGVLWLVISAAVASIVAIRQFGDVLSAGGETDAAQFATGIGGVSVGMAPFNLTAALVSPIVAVAVAVLAWRPLSLRWGLAGPSVMTAIVALAFVPGAAAAGTWWLDSYYVQKALNASLLVTVPLVAAAVSVAAAVAARQVNARNTVAGAVLVSLVGIAVFSSSGTREDPVLVGFPRFPGLDAVDQRSQGDSQRWLGALILSGVDATEDLPGFAPVLWEGPGTLANLWAGSLQGNLSSTQQVFYLSLPQPPTGQPAAEWAKQALSAYPDLRIAFIPPSQESAEFLRLRFGSADPRRVVVVTD